MTNLDEMGYMILNDTMKKDYDCSGLDMRSYNSPIHEQLDNNPGKLPLLELTTKKLIKKHYPKIRKASMEDSVFNDKSKRLLMFLHKMWLDQSMCDMVIHAQGGTIMTHQTVVGTYSPALSYLFAQNSLQKIANVRMCNVSVEVLADVLNCLYTTDLKLNESNIEQVILCAKQLDMPLFKEVCKDYLLKCLDTTNMIFHYSLAANYDLEPPKSHLLELLASNLNELQGQNQILLLPVERLKSILKHPNAKTTVESLLEIIVNWLAYDECNRLENSKPLFDLIDLTQISPEQLSSVIDTNEWLLDDTHCRDKILKAFK